MMCSQCYGKADLIHFTAPVELLDICLFTQCISVRDKNRHNLDYQTSNCMVIILFNIKRKMHNKITGSPGF